jgi:hypothetical protein
MKIRKILKPGQPGTKKWVEKFGADLLCVRYRYDEERQRKLKTVELVVEEKFWEPDEKRIPRNKVMSVRIFPNEPHLQRVVKAAGGRWIPQKKVWELAYGEILDLGLEKRIVKEEIKNG